MTEINCDVPVIGFVWNFHGKGFPHHFTDTVTFYTLFIYFVTCSRLGVSRQTVQTLCHPRPVQLYTVYTPRYCDADRETPGGGTRAMPRMSRNGWYGPQPLLSPGSGHWTSQSRCRDHSVSGHRTDIGLNWHNLIIVMRPDSPCQDFRHTSIWFLTFSLKWWSNLSSDMMMIAMASLLLQSHWASPPNHLDTIVFHFWMNRAMMRLEGETKDVIKCLME